MFVWRLISSPIEALYINYGPAELLEWPVERRREHLGQSRSFFDTLSLNCCRILISSVSVFAYLCKERVLCLCSINRFLEAQNGFICQCPRCEAEAASKVDSSKRKWPNNSGMQCFKTSAGLQARYKVVVNLHLSKQKLVACNILQCFCLHQMC